MPAAADCLKKLHPDAGLAERDSYDQREQANTREKKSRIKRRGFLSRGNRRKNGGGGSCNFRHGKFQSK
jgi:hypothetical protein